LEPEISMNNENNDKTVKKKSKKDEILPFGWCEIYSSEEAVSEESIAIYRQSVPLFIVIVSFMDVLECLAEAFDICGDEVSTRKDDQLFDIEVIRIALSLVRSKFPSMLTARMIEVKVSF
jgi:hypothetical protein